MRKAKKSLRTKRTERVRAKLFGTANKPRLSVFRSNKSIYAQIVNDETGTTLVAASEVDLKKLKSKGEKAEKAEQVGQILSKKAVKKGIKEVVFDRGPYKYHGRIKKLAESARKEGLKF